MNTFFVTILGAFTKLWKEAISFVMSVYPSVRTEQLRSHWTDFHEIQVSLKSDNNNGLYKKINVKLRSRLIFLRLRNISDKSCTENQIMHFMFNSFLRKSCRLWDNVGKYCRAGQATDDNRTRRMCFTCWRTKATGTHSVSNTYCFPTDCTNAPHCYVICQPSVLLLSPNFAPAFCRTSCIYEDVIRVTPQCTWIIYSQLCNPSPFHFWSLLYFWPQPKGLWHFHTTRYVI